MNINYKSDFTLRCRFRGPDNVTVDFPDFDFNIELLTDADVQYPYPRIFLATRRGSELDNCVNLDGTVVVTANSHRLLPGRLTARLTAMLPDSLMPDGIKRVSVSVLTDIYISTENSDSFERPEIIFSLPFTATESPQQPPQSSEHEWIDRVKLNSAMQGYLPTSGGTMTGRLNFGSIAAHAFANATHGVWLQYGQNFINVNDDGVFYNGSFKVWNASNHGAGSGLDADNLDGCQATELSPLSIYNPRKGVLVTTSALQSTPRMLIFHIIGHSYVNEIPINTMVMAYTYNGSTFINGKSLLNLGFKIPFVKVFFADGVAKLWIPYISNFCSFEVSCHALNESGIVCNRVVSLADSEDVSEDGECALQINPINTLLSSDAIARPDGTPALYGREFAGIYLTPAVASFYGISQMMSPLRVVVSGAVPADVLADTSSIWYCPNVGFYRSNGSAMVKANDVAVDWDGGLYLCKGKYYSICGGAFAVMMEQGVAPLFASDTTDDGDVDLFDGIMWSLDGPYPENGKGPFKVSDSDAERIRTAERFRIVGSKYVSFDLRAAMRIPQGSDFLIVCEPISVNGDTQTPLIVLSLNGSSYYVDLIMGEYASIAANLNL